MRPLIIMTTAIFLVALTGCTSTGTTWKRGGATASQFSADNAACRSYANRVAEDAYSDRTGIGYSGGVSNDAQYYVLMQRHNALQDARTQFELCLKRRGYRRVAPNAGKKYKIRQ